MGGWFLFTVTQDTTWRHRTWSSVVQVKYVSQHWLIVTLTHQNKLKLKWNLKSLQSRKWIRINHLGYSSHLVRPKCVKRPIFVLQILLFSAWAYAMHSTYKNATFHISCIKLIINCFLCGSFFHGNIGLIGRRVVLIYIFTVPLTLMVRYTGYLIRHICRWWPIAGTVDI